MAATAAVPGARLGRYPEARHPKPARHDRPCDRPQVAAATRAVPWSGIAGAGFTRAVALWYLRPSMPETSEANAIADSALEREIKQLIIDALMLEDRTADEIDAAAPLFGEGGLGLDSIDVLELAMALHKRYGVKTKGDDTRNREIFASVRSLAAFVDTERKVAGS
jgi:acyl carrier protein